jgi:hypothetical protein
MRLARCAGACYAAAVRSLFLIECALVVALGAVGCGRRGEATDTAPSSTSGADTTAGDPTTGSTGGPDTVGTAETTAPADTSSTGDDSPQGECTLWADECGPDQKCMPWSLEADEIPDEIRCCAAPESPDLIGEPCEVLDYNGSCIDSCERGAFCVLDDPAGLTGQCRRFCQPGANDCQPDETCKTFYELLNDVPTVPLCMEQCDPLNQDCSVPSWLCIPDSPTQAGQSGFICVSPPPNEPYGVFEPCALANQCEPGLVCVTADRVPGCSFTSCCTSYCSLSEGDAPCQALDPNLACIDWQAPDPTWVDVGVCALPE